MDATALRALGTVAVLLVPAGCTERNPEYCEDSTQCTDPAAPFCDIAGEHGNRNTCVPVPYDAGAPPFDAGLPMFDASSQPDGSATLSVTITGSGAGAVASTPGGIDCGATCEGEFALGSQVMLSAVPESGTTFVSWGGDCPRSFEDCALSMIANRAVTATFGIVGEHLWSKGVGAGGDDKAHDAAFDADGNLIVVGSFTGSVDFGDGSPLTADGQDGFVAKYDRDGALQWVQQLGASGIDAIYGVAIDPGGDVYATGSLNEMDSMPYPMLIIKLSAGGAELWRKEVSGTGATVPAAIAANESNVVSVGFFSGSVNFGGGEVMGRATDGYVVWHTTAGNFVRAIRVQATLPDLSFEFTTDVALDSDGNVVIVGTTTGTTFDLGGGSMPPLGATDFYVAKLSNVGAHRWSRRFGGTEVDSATSVAVDADGNIYVTGTFEGSADFGNGTVTANTATVGGSDAYIVSYSALDGDYRWLSHYGDTHGSNQGIAVASSPRGSVVATGMFDASVDFGDGELTAAGDTDLYVTRATASDGAHIRTAVFGAADDHSTDSPDEVTSIAVDNIGRMAIVGSTANTLSFGGPAVVSSGGTDLFLAVFGP